MYWYQYLSLVCLSVCLSACLWHFFRLVRLGKPKDLSKKSGNVTKAVIYSNTTAMLPNKKESAYLHLPTYTAGILFHIGIFISLLLFVFTFFNKIGIWLFAYWWIPICIICFLLISFSCGLFLFFKRLFSKKIRHLSNLDDYFSEIIVTLFQFATMLLLLFTTFQLPHYFYIVCLYYVIASLLFLYLPLGKLKHVVYFFAARYQLGFFYGWRNSWPPSTK
jgi:nitrate reductase gamma subunit